MHRSGSSTRIPTRTRSCGNELADHLFPLQRAGLIEVWHDREMLPGDTVDEEIAQKLRSADLILVLVSPSRLLLGQRIEKRD